MSKMVTHFMSCRTWSLHSLDNCFVEGGRRVAGSGLGGMTSLISLEEGQLLRTPPQGEISGPGATARSHTLLSGRNAMNLAPSLHFRGD